MLDPVLLLHMAQRMHWIDMLIATWCFCATAVFQLPWARHIARCVISDEPKEWKKHVDAAWWYECIDYFII